MAKKIESPHQISKRALSAAISAVCAGVPAAYAQEAEPEEGQDTGDELRIEEILVTATKRGELSMQDVPMAITAFSSEDIRLQGFKNMDDYAAQIPSLAFGRREPGGSSVIMRGCSVSAVAFSDNATTSIYLDEQPISQQGFNPDVRLVDIERLEALSGPQGTLFGEASQCGTLRIITNKPDASKSESWVDITANNVDDGDSGYDVSVMINAPLIQDKLALRFVGFTSEDAAWIDNILGESPARTFDNAAWVEDNINTTETDGARVSLRWTPGDNWSFDFQGTYQDTTGTGFGDVDLSEPDGIYEDRGLGEWEQLRFQHEKWSDEWYQLSLVAEGSLGWADATITAGYGSRDTRYDADSTAYIYTFQYYTNYLRECCELGGLYDFGGDPHGLSVDIQEVDRFSFEARLSSPADEDSRWSWIGGVFYNTVESGPQSFTAETLGMSENCTVDYPAFAEGCPGHFIYASYLHYYYFGTMSPLSDNFWTGIYEDNLEQKAVFGEVSIDLSENLSITLGGRWYDIEFDRITRQGTLVVPPSTGGSFVMNCGTAADRAAWQVEFDENKFEEGVGGWVGGTPVSGFDICYADDFATASESGFVPKVNLTYTFDDDTMVWFTYSEGFRSGGVNSAKAGSFYGPGGQFHTFDSDNLFNYEIGAKTTSADGRFQFNITAFHMVWEDIQIEAVDPEASFYSLGLLNFPEAEIDGFEADFTWIPAANWSISGTLAYNDAALSETVTLFPDGPDPKQSVSGTRLPLIPKWKGSLLAKYTLNSNLWGAEPYLLGVYQYQGDSVNSLDGIQSIVEAKAVRTHPSFSEVNLRFGLEGNNWSASIFVDNVFNEYGLKLYNDRWTQTRLTANRPRTFGINFRKTWD